MGPPDADGGPGDSHPFRSERRTISVLDFLLDFVDRQSVSVLARDAVARRLRPACRACDSTGLRWRQILTREATMAADNSDTNCATGAASNRPPTSEQAVAPAAAVQFGSVKHVGRATRKPINAS